MNNLGLYEDADPGFNPAPNSPQLKTYDSLFQKYHWKIEPQPANISPLFKIYRLGTIKIEIRETAGTKGTQFTWKSIDDARPNAMSPKGKTYETLEQFLFDYDQALLRAADAAKGPHPWDPKPQPM